MKTYKFSFHGRQTGAIGITYDITQAYEANTLNEACTMLFKDYEPWRNLKLNGKEFKIETKHLGDPIIKTYKGLVMKRK